MILEDEDGRRIEFVALLTDELFICIGRPSEKPSAALLSVEQVKLLKQYLLLTGETQ